MQLLLLWLAARWEQSSSLVAALRELLGLPLLLLELLLLLLLLGQKLQHLWGERALLGVAESSQSLQLAEQGELWQAQTP